VGEFGAAAELIARHGIAADQVLNTSVALIMAHLARRKNRKV